jgi:hypothetical protein
MLFGWPDLPLVKMAFSGDHSSTIILLDINDEFASKNLNRIQIFTNYFAQLL